MSMEKLNYEQVKRMSSIISSEFSVHSLGDYPDLKIEPERLILAIQQRLEECLIFMKDIRINGGSASAVVGGLEENTFNDLDILFNLEPSGQHMFDRNKHDLIRVRVLETLVEFIPSIDHNGNIMEKGHLSLEKLADEYLQKSICVQNGSNDLWSLITLRNNAGKNIELKFVDRLKRKYEFSIDSFQLIINDYLEHLQTFKDGSSANITATVEVESVFGDYQTALRDLKERQIRTKNPEEIRGGGLLKYCYLVSCGYADPEEPSTFKKYMCSRFFIDFPEIQRQQMQFENYLANHFSSSDDNSKRAFLACVLSLIQKNSVCLPSRERNKTLSLLNAIASRYSPTSPSDEASNTCYQLQNNQVSYAYYNNNNNIYSNFNNMYSNKNIQNNIYNNNSINIFHTNFNNIQLGFFTTHLPAQPTIKS